MKIRNLLMSVVLLGTTAACSSELDAPELSGEGEEVTVTYSVTLPDGIQSRAFSDGTKACNLHYAVYEIASSESSKAEVAEVAADAADAEATEAAAEEAALAQRKLKFTENVSISKNTPQEVKLNLIKGNKYEVIFWAQSDEAPFTYKDATQTVTYDYDNAVANSDDTDAFYDYEYIDVTCVVSKSIVLTRPFAQINFGTDDIAKAQQMGIRVNRTTISVNAYTKLNLRSGKATEAKKVKLKSADIPEDETFPGGDSYDYIAMGYFLVPIDKSIIDVTLNVDNGKFEQTYSNIPVQRNYRTNIYGSLITDPANYEVVVNNDYDGDDHNVSIWDGESIEAIKPDADGVIKINNAAQLARLSEASNWGNYNEGYTIKLMTDIDLNHKIWNPIAANDMDYGWGDYDEDEDEYSEYHTPEFRGTFDGNGHTIYNLHVDLDRATNPDAEENIYAGFFGNVSGATIKNLTIENATIENNNQTRSDIYMTGVLAGATGFKTVDGKEVGTTIDNVTIKGLVVVTANGGEIGGLIGRGYTTTDISNITINVDKGSYVKGVNCDYCGGVAGVMWKGTIENITSNIDVKASNPKGSWTAGSPNPTVKYKTAVGGLFGGVEAGANELNNCSSSGSIELYNYIVPETESTDSVNPYLMPVGGLVGTNTATSFKTTFNGCSFTGTFSSYQVNGNTNTDNTNTVKDNNTNWQYLGWILNGSTFSTNAEKVATND